MDRKTHGTSPYPAEFRERAVQMVVDHLESYRSLTAAVSDIARKLGCSSDSLRVWYKQAQRDAGKEAGPTSAEKARIKELEREVRELRQGEEDQETVRWTVSPTNEILSEEDQENVRGTFSPTSASAYFAQAELDRPFRK